MVKAPDAFRTISEVSETLNTPAHVLRFWESKFSQIKPVKRAGGRRYYRPDDISLLAGIKHLLHEQGMTIKGAQKLLRENGVKHVAGLVALPTVGLAASNALSMPKIREVPRTKPVVVSDEAPVVSSQGDDTRDDEDDSQTNLFSTETVQSTQFLSDDILENLTSVDTPAPGTSRFFTSDSSWNVEAIQHNAAKIQPYIAKLERIRDRLRAG